MVLGSMVNRKGEALTSWCLWVSDGTDLKFVLQTTI